MCIDFSKTVSFLYILIACFFHLNISQLFLLAKYYSLATWIYFQCIFLLTIFSGKSNTCTRLNGVNNVPMIEEGKYLSRSSSSASLLLSLEAVTGNMSEHLWECLLLLDFLDCTVSLCLDDLWLNYFECFWAVDKLCVRDPCLFFMLASTVNARTTSVPKMLI